MEQTNDTEELKALRDYADGLTGTRETIQRAGLGDYADLVIALAQNGFDFPKPDDTPERRAQVAMASSVLQPLLRHGR